MHRKLYPFYPAIAWFILTVILLTLPGDQLPKDDLFKIPNLDKSIHVILFFVLCYLFSRPFRRSVEQHLKKGWFYKIALAALAYGIIMELVQKYFIPFRSFDLWDILADGIGCAIAYWWSTRFFMKVLEKK